MEADRVHWRRSRRHGHVGTLHRRGSAARTHPFPRENEGGAPLDGGGGAALASRRPSAEWRTYAPLAGAVRPRSCLSCQVRSESLALSEVSGTVSPSKLLRTVPRQATRSSRDAWGSVTVAAKGRVTVPFEARRGARPPRRPARTRHHHHRPGPLGPDPKSDVGRSKLPACQCSE